METGMVPATAEERAKAKDVAMEARVQERALLRRTRLPMAASIAEDPIG